MCYKRNPDLKPETPHLQSTSNNSQGAQVREGCFRDVLKCRRERDYSVVTFPLYLVGTVARLPGASVPTIYSWIEDSDGDAIMCLHDCGGQFCFKRFADKWVKHYLAKTIEQVEQRRYTGVEKISLVITQRDEEAIWQTMVSYNTPNNGFGESQSMDIDEVL